jgi:histidine ammonia-lyase
MSTPRPSAPARSEAARPTLRLDARPIALADFLAAARNELRVELDPDPRLRRRLEEGRHALKRWLDKGQAVYGVTTGVGSSITTQVPPDEREQMALNLVRFHGCGTGRRLDPEAAAAVVVARLISLARGYSSVRPVVLERLCALLEHRILPCIPEEGSVGASGDLTPLSYLAALVVGEREALVDGDVVPAREALSMVGLKPLVLEPKESLALMNGTSVMTALGCIASDRAMRLARLSCRITAMVSHAISGNRGHFAPEIFALKPHRGTCQAAEWIRDDLGAAGGRAPARLQDRYSIRCAPHVIGVLLDALDFDRELLEIELNGVDDNPIVDPDSGDVYHGGNFYGGHVAFAMDGLKAAVASVADLLDRQLQLLCTPDTSDGLPANLMRRPSHHGFKAMQISTSALAAESLKLSMPAASFSRSTESHNQDKVSMGTIAARDCMRVTELTETLAAISLLAACQALELRGSPPPRLACLLESVRTVAPTLDVDRRQDQDIEQVLRLHRSGRLLATS